ncbi:MAG TPA: hypothetical protein VIW80_21540 [Pyrinomonadaceae bacterium]
MMQEISGCDSSVDFTGHTSLSLGPTPDVTLLSERARAAQT